MAQNQTEVIGTMAQNTFFHVLTLENPKFATYMIVSSLLILKMMGLTIFTIYQRMRNKATISEEDAKWNGGTTEKCEDVERVRRAFQNDLENIPAFIFISLLYLWVSVPGAVVHLLYWLFFIVRTGHSIVYAVYVIPQPARAICFCVGFLIIFYMSIHVFIYALAVGYF